MTQSIPQKSVVLYADDDLDDVQLIADAFAPYRSVIDLHTFANGMDLLLHLEGKVSEPPCLVILDINMPILNGKETLRAIRNLKHFEELPVVLFSTSTLPSEKAFARSLNAGFCPKPLHYEHIDLIVEEMLDQCAEDVKTRLRNGRMNS